MATVSKPVTNYGVLGQPVAEARVRAVDDDQGIYICDLVAADGTVLASDRYFYQASAPFEALTPDEQALFSS